MYLVHISSFSCSAAYRLKILSNRSAAVAGGAALHVKRTEAFFKGILEAKSAKNTSPSFRNLVALKFESELAFVFETTSILKNWPRGLLLVFGIFNAILTLAYILWFLRVGRLMLSRVIAMQLNNWPRGIRVISDLSGKRKAYAAMVQQLEVDPQTLSGAVINPDSVARVLADQ